MRATLTVLPPPPPPPRLLLLLLGAAAAVQAGATGPAPSPDQQLCRQYLLLLVHSIMQE